MRLFLLFLSRDVRKYYYGQKVYILRIGGALYGMAL